MSLRWMLLPNSTSNVTGITNKMYSSSSSTHHYYFYYIILHTEYLYKRENTKYAEVYAVYAGTTTSYTKAYEMKAIFNICSGAF